MKIKIESDVHDIVERIKYIDDGYFVVYNLVTNKYELHNYKQINSYCLTVPYSRLDSRLIDLIYKTNIINIDNIINEIDSNNEVIENNSIKNIKDVSDYKMREIYKYANNSSKELNYEKAFCDNWR